MASLCKHVLAKVGRWYLASARTSGEVARLSWDVLRCLFRYPIRWRLLSDQIYFLGSTSMVIIITTGIFTGAVFAAQVQFQFVRLSMESATGPTVSIAIARELGPVLCALFLSGRVGAAMAAEIASMKVTEQIDALRSMGVYVVEYLVVPRFLAMLIVVPLLTAIAIAVGIGSGFFVACVLLGADAAYYWDNTLKFTSYRDMLIGLSKGLLFGVIIVLISCHKGLTAPRHAAGVGQTTTQAVVNASLAVLISDFFLTLILNQLLIE